MKEPDLEPVAFVVHRVLDLMESSAINQAEGVFNHFAKYYRWKVYAIEDKVGPPTFRIDVKEEK